jgi:hypothetical protein
MGPLRALDLPDVVWEDGSDQSSCRNEVGQFQVHEVAVGGG